MSATAANRTFSFVWNQSFLDLLFAHSRRSSNWMIAENGGSAKMQRVVINQ
jgi:hypothetical protein